MTTNEKDIAIWIANKALDVPNADPDSNMCIVCRQYLRAIEEIEALKFQLKKTKNETSTNI